MARFNVVIPCPHCRSMVQWKVDLQNQLEAESCLVCHREFSESYKEAVASFIGESSLRRSSRGRPKSVIV